MNPEYLEEVEAWEQGLAVRAMQRMYKTSKNYRDPRYEVMRKYRRRSRYSLKKYCHECKYVRKLTNRKLRRMLQRELYNEAYYSVVPHDYKTYGWDTW